MTTSLSSWWSAGSTLVKLTVVSLYTALWTSCCRDILSATSFETDMRLGCCQSSIQMVLSQAITAATYRVKTWIETFTLMMTKIARNVALKLKCSAPNWNLSFPLSWQIDSKFFLIFTLTHVPQVFSHMLLNLSLRKINLTCKDCPRFFTIRVRISCSRTVGSPTTNIKRIVRGWL